MVPTAAQSALYLEARRLLDRGTRWLLQARGGSIDVAEEVARFREPVARLAPSFPACCWVPSRSACSGGRRTSSRSARPRDLALEAAALLDAFALLDVVDVAAARTRTPRLVLALYFAISERYEIDRMLTRITALPRDDRWSSLARQALRSDLYAAVAGLHRAGAPRHAGGRGPG